MFTQKQISTATQQSQVTTKVVSGLKCPDCHQKSVTVKLLRGAVNAGSAKCHACGWSVQGCATFRWHRGKVPKLWLVRVPCFGLAFGQATVRGTVLRRLWLGRKRSLHASSRHFAWARTFTLTKANNGNGQTTKFNRESDHALMAFPRLTRRLCSFTIVATNPFAHFCGQRYRQLEAEETLASAKSSFVTLLRCDCGVFPCQG